MYKIETEEEKEKRLELFLNALVDKKNTKKILEEINKNVEEIKALKNEHSQYPYFIALYVYVSNIIGRLQYVEETVHRVNTENEFLDFIYEIGELYYYTNKYGFEAYFENEDYIDINFIEIDIDNIDSIKDCFEKAIARRKRAEEEFENYYGDYYEGDDFVENDSEYQKEMKRLYKVYENLEKKFYKDLDILVKYKLENNKIF